MPLQFETVRITINVPVDLLTRSQHFIDDSIISDRNTLFVMALEQFLLKLERQEIDLRFEVMAEDNEYQAMNQQLAEDFSDSDWEALAELDL